jgi:peptide/nickel transport system ATP-binding protein
MAQKFAVTFTEAEMPESQLLLEVNRLSKSYPLGGGFFDSPRGKIQAVDHLSFSIHRGQTLGLVGESGSGKTTTGRMVVRVVEPDSGEIAFWDEEVGRIDLAKLSNRAIRPLRKKIQMIFQDPYSSLDPRMTVMRIVAEPLRATGNPTKQATRDRVAEVLEMVGLGHEYMNRYPHAFSGGQRQRIGIARALVTEPRLVVADEAVSALDVSVQAQILNLLRSLQERLTLTYLFIAHDLGVVRYISDVVAVMYRGRLVEIANKADLYSHPKHPYTESLLVAAPRPEPGQTPVETKAMDRLSADNVVATGCPYFLRCGYRREVCGHEVPPLRDVGTGHKVACHFDLTLTNSGSPGFCPITELAPKNRTAGYLTSVDRREEL